MDADKLLDEWTDVTSRARRPGRAPKDGRVPLAGPVFRLVGVATMALVIVAAIAVVAPRQSGPSVGGVAAISPSPAASGFDCPVTAPNGLGSDGRPATVPSHGVDGLSVELDPGLTMIDYRFSVENGATGVIFNFHRAPHAQGDFLVTARRLDGPGALVRATILDRTVGVDTNVAVLPFPVDGCWEITATSGPAVLTFVVQGPNARFFPERSPWPDTFCAVTVPNQAHTTGWPASELDHGVDGLYTVLFPDGILRIPPDGVEPDGSLGMKMVFFRDPTAAGRFTVTGRRLDGIALPLRADIPDGYGESGVQATGLHFPTEGCWEITVTSGPATLTFVTQVALAAGDRLMPSQTP